MQHRIRGVTVHRVIDPVGLLNTCGKGHLGHLLPVVYIHPRNKAEYLVHSMGDKARQYVVDQIVDAIRGHDMPLAHVWEQVGQCVDNIMMAPDSG